MKTIMEPAKTCPTCGGALYSTKETCQYCGAIVPQNVLYNKEKLLEQREQEIDLRKKELEKEYRVVEAKKKKDVSDNRLLIFLFAFILIVIFLLRFR